MSFIVLKVLAFISYETVLVYEKSENQATQSELIIWIKSKSGGDY